MEWVSVADLGGFFNPDREGFQFPMDVKEKYLKMALKAERAGCASPGLLSFPTGLLRTQSVFQQTSPWWRLLRL